MGEAPPLGAKVRALRRQSNLTQVQLAERLGISPSYLNLIEHNRRGLSASVLIRLAQVFELDLKSFAGEHDARTVADLLEVFGDPLFEGHELAAAEVRELAATAPSVARAVVALYHSYRNAHESANTLALKLSEDDEHAGIDSSRLPSEEVSDLIQRHKNYFPELEQGAELLWSSGLLAGDLYEGMVRYLDEHHGVEVGIGKVGAMRDAVRRYDPERRVLTLSEALRRGSRNFQVAYQLGLLTQQSALDRISRDPLLTSDESRALGRVALASYFAGAVLMPYLPFLEAARS